MRKIVIFVAGVAVLGAPVCVWGTGFGSVVSSFKSPGGYPLGLSYRAGYLYISAHACNVLWRTTTTGSVISYHPLKIQNSGVTVGTINSATYYWVVDSSSNYVYRYVDNSSSVVGSFPAPGFEPWGLAFVDADHMYHTNTEPGLLYLLHPITGSVYSSYPLSFYASDLAYDQAGYLWIAGPQAEYKKIYKSRLNGSVLASFSTMSYGYPQGCAFDGEYVWVGTSDWGIYTILRFNVQEHPSVLPASFGKVKGLFR